MCSKAFKVIGFVLVGLIFLGLWMQVIMALQNNQPFYGVNYLHLPLGTVTGLIVLSALTAVVPVAGGRNLLAAINRRRATRTRLSMEVDAR